MNARGMTLQQERVDRETLPSVGHAGGCMTGTTPLARSGTDSAGAARRSRIAVVSGGVGAARFLRALEAVVPGADLVAIVNTGDDAVLHGLSISPDLDTITYTLAGAIDPERGWGLGG